MELRGTRALVTGASSGIGAEISKELARRGAAVTLVARGAEALGRVAEEIVADGGVAVVEPCDLASSEAIAALAERVCEPDGPPDVLVNNAGTGQWRAIDELDADYVHFATRLPYSAAYELTAHLVPGMIARSSGWILNITSAAGYIAVPGANAYATARWAMRGFSYQLHADLRGTGVGVGLLAPFEVDTPYFDNNPGSRERIPKIAKLVGEMTQAQVAVEAAEMIEQERRERIVPARGRWILRLTPEPVLRRLVARTGWRR